MKNPLKFLTRNRRQAKVTDVNTTPPQPEEPKQMSTNKFRYYDVVTVTTVKALNQSDAISAATSTKRPRGATVLGTSTDAERITASEARTWVESLNS